MSTIANDTLQATSAIMAAYAGNPTPMPQEKLLELIDKVHTKLQSLGGSGEGASILSDVARQSMAGSEVMVEKRDPAEIWPDATPEQRAKYMALIEEHNLQQDENGFAIPRRQRDRLVEPDLVYDPFSGKGFKMLRRHLDHAYGLNQNEISALFNLGEDFRITAPNYSASKAAYAAKQGLGRGNKKSEAAEASRKAAAAKPVKASKATTAKAPAKPKATTAKQTAKPAAKQTTARTGKATTGKAKNSGTSKRTTRTTVAA